MSTCSWRVMYRTGGRDRFQWHWMLGGYYDLKLAEREAQEIQQMGYTALVVDTTNESELPTTYNP